MIQTRRDDVHKGDANFPTTVCGEVESERREGNAKILIGTRSQHSQRVGKINRVCAAA